MLAELPDGARILILRLRSLGDLLLSLPAVEALHRWRPDLRIVFGVEPAWAGLFAGHPAIAEVLVVGRWTSAAQRIRRERFPVVYDQHGGPTSALLLGVSGAPVRVGWQRSQFAWLANVRVPPPESFFGSRPVHTVEHRLTQFYWTGLPRGEVPAGRIVVKTAAVTRLAQRLTAEGVDPREPLVVLHPGAGDDLRRWPLSRFAELSRRLAQRGVLPVVPFGPEENELRGEFQQLHGNSALVLSGLAMEELAALFSRARLFVGNDSGPTHLAAAVGCPVVAVFGPTRAEWWRPWTPFSRVVQGECVCGRAWPKRCRRGPVPQCLQQISVERVEQACLALLTSSPPATYAPAPTRERN